MPLCDVKNFQFQAQHRRIHNSSQYITRSHNISHSSSQQEVLKSQMHPPTHPNPSQVFKKRGTLTKSTPCQVACAPVFGREETARLNCGILGILLFWGGCDMHYHCYPPTPEAGASEKPCRFPILGAWQAAVSQGGSAPWRVGALGWRMLAGWIG